MWLFVENEMWLYHCGYIAVVIYLAQDEEETTQVLDQYARVIRASQQYDSKVRGSADDDDVSDEEVTI